MSDNVNFFNSVHCKSLMHCPACRTSSQWRQTLVRAKLVADTDFACPRGYTTEKLPTKEALVLAQELVTYKKKNYPCCDGTRSE